MLAHWAASTHHEGGARPDEPVEGVQQGRLLQHPDLLGPNVKHLLLEGRLPRVQLQHLARTVGQSDNLQMKCSTCFGSEKHQINQYIKGLT